MPSTSESLKLRDGAAATLLLTSSAAATSNLPIAPVLAGLSLYIALLVYTRGVTSIPRSTMYCAAYFLYIAGSALLSGMPPAEFLNYSFYRYDGNVFASFIPFLIAPALVAHTLPLRPLLSGTLAAISILLFLSETLAPGLLFRSHNALGGFVGVILMVNLVLLKGIPWGITLLVNLATLALSDSRGSQLGVALAMGTIFIGRMGWRRLSTLAPFLAIAASVSIAIFGYGVWNRIGRPEALDIAEFAETKEVVERIGGDEVGSIADIGARGATISHRLFFIWPVAIGDFLKSPIIGIGFGRFDDRPVELEGVDGLVALNTTPRIQHTDLHAHHSFLHIAAETGVAGILLVMGLLTSLWRESNDLTPQYRTAVRAILLYIIFSSCTEHRLTTPATMLPAASILVLMLTSKSARAKQEGDSPWWPT